MPDYNLAGLSARSFEQLVQALAAKVIGPGIVVFGDGPDGAREATFEGRIPYPTSEHRWDGYCVLQAKFRQRPQGTREDGEWAVAELKKELAKFADPRRALRPPDYYILATNVVLSAAKDTGAKDKVAGVVAEFRSRVPIREHTIWDYDQIRTYLDGAEDIRCAYEGWITTGDVLAEVMRRIKPERQDFAEVLGNFLQKELLGDVYVNLEQAGHTNEERIPLARVFVDLPASPQQRAEDEEDERDREATPGFVSQVIELGGQKLDPKSCRRIRERQLSPQVPVDPEPGRLVLIGGPGQGKTTVVQFICQLYRLAIINARQGRPQTREVEDAIREVEQQCAKEGIAVPSARRFPIRVVLSDLAAQLASREAGHPTSVASYLVRRISVRTDMEVSASDLRSLLSTYPWVIILDGLDEVPASSNRAEVLDAIRDFLIDLGDANSDALVLATTRPQGYNADFSPECYKHLWLDPLSPKHRIHYATRLVEATTLVGDRERVLHMLQEASRQEATARLMTTPLQVTIMAALVRYVGPPPQDRWRLFSQYYEVIYRREMQRNIPLASILKDHQPDIDAIHRQVGLLLQVGSEEAGGTAARLTADGFGKVVQRRLEEEGHGGAAMLDLRRRIIEAATIRLVFLAGLEADKVGFEVRSLQEFMAAEALMDGADAIVVKRLQAIAPVPHWRNVFLYAAGKCFAVRQHLRETVLAVCTALNEDSEDPASCRILAGSMLALDLLHDGCSRQQPRYQRPLLRCALRLLDLPADDCHSRLAGAYRPEHLDLFRQEIEHRMPHADFSDRQGAWRVLLELAARGVRYGLDAADAGWPTDPMQELEVLASSGNWRYDMLAFRKAVALIPRLPPAEGVDLAQRVVLGRRRGPEIPPWCAALAAQWREQALNVWLPTGERIACRLGRTLFACCADLADVLGMPDGRAEWGFVLDGARFALEPSKAGLAAALRSWAVHGRQSDAEAVNFLLSWPLGMCLDAVDSSESALRLVGAAEAGELGDVEEWRAAETRWQTEGGQGSDLEYMDGCALPFDSQIGKRGFPVPLLSRMHVDGERGSRSLCGVLYGYYRAARSVRQRCKLAEAFAWSLCQLPTHSLMQLGASREDVLVLVQDLSIGRSLSLVAGVIAAVPREYFQDRTWLGALDRILKEDWLAVLGSFEEGEGMGSQHSEQVAGDLAATGSQAGLLLYAAIALAQDHSLGLLAHVVPEACAESHARIAGMVIELLEADLSVDDGRRLASLLISTIKDSSMAWDVMLVCLSKRVPASPGDQEFLLELDRRAPVGAAWQRAVLLRRLREGVSCRRSPMCDPSRRRDLGLSLATLDRP